MEQPVVSAGAPNTQPIPAEPQVGNDSKTPSESNTQASQMYDVKVNGQVRKYTLDQLMAKASLGEAAHEKFEQANQLSKKSQSFQDKVKKDFIEALQDPELGLSKEQIKTRFETWYKQNFIDPEVMTPEQKELAELKAWRERQERDNQEREETLKQQQEAQMDFQTRQQLETDIIKTLDASNLPKTRETVARIAFFMKQNLAKGYDAPMEVIVQQVRESVSSNFQQYFKDASIEQWVQLIGEEGINKLRKYDLERLKQKFPTAQPEDKNGTRSSHKKGEKVPMSKVDDYFNELRRGK